MNNRVSLLVPDVHAVRLGRSGRCGTSQGRRFPGRRRRPRSLLLQFASLSSRSLSPSSVTVVSLSLSLRACTLRPRAAEDATARRLLRGSSQDKGGRRWMTNITHTCARARGGAEERVLEQVRRCEGKGGGWGWSGYLNTVAPKVVCCFVSRFLFVNREYHMCRHRHCLVSAGHGCCTFQLEGGKQVLTTMYQFLDLFPLGCSSCLAARADTGSSETTRVRWVMTCHVIYNVRWWV